MVWKRQLRVLTVVLVLLSMADVGLFVWAPTVIAQGTLSNQVLALLSRINTWTATNTFNDLRVANTAIPSTTTYRIYADTTGNLYFNGGLIAGSGGGVTPHNFLSTTHTDTVAASAARGAVVVGNATPAWARLTVGAAGRFLRSDGTDVSWGTDGAGLTGITSTSFANGAIPYAKLTVTGAILNADLAGSIAYSKLTLTGALVNADLSSSAAIAYSKLALTGSILNADVNASAAIAYSKLNLSGSILNADINSAAAIAYSKLNLSTSIVNGDLTNATILFAKWAGNSCTSGQVPQYNGSAWVCATVGTGAGTVTSVALSLPAMLTVSGSPVTTSGTLSATLATQSANLVFAGPNTGAAAAPTFRSLVNADFPLSGVAAGTYAKVAVNTAGIVTAATAQASLTADVSGTLPRANGGTGVAVSADDTVLVGSGTAWVAQALPDCPTGALAYTQATNLFNCSSTAAAHNILSTTHSDTLAASVVRGDVMVGNSTPKWARVAVGTAGQVLTTDGTDTSWGNTLARGSIGTSVPWSFTQTWTVGGTTYRAIELAVTNTASAAGSTLLRLLAGAGGATTMFSVDSAGVASFASNLVPTVAGTPTLGTNALPFGSTFLGTAATNNLAVTPAAFGQAVTATVDDPALAAVKLPLARRGTIAYTSGAISGGACAAAVTATVTGLATTATVLASLNTTPQTAWKTGVTFYAYPTANTVNVMVCNPTAGSITPESATFNWTAIVP